MFCTSQPHKPQPKARPRRASTRKEMAEVVGELMTSSGCVQKDDLKRAGFTDVEIETHGESAVAAARKARRSISIDA